MTDAGIVERKKARSSSGIPSSPIKTKFPAVFFPSGKLQNYGFGVMHIFGKSTFD